jgi:hypothetical protein
LIHLARGDLNEPIFNQLGDTTDAFHLLHHLDFIQGFFISSNGPVVLDYKLLIILPHMIANSTAAHKTLPRKNYIQNVIKMVVDPYLPDWLRQRFEKRILRDLYWEFHWEATVIFIGVILGRFCLQVNLRSGTSK